MSIDVDKGKKERKRSQFMSVEKDEECQLVSCWLTRDVAAKAQKFKSIA